MLLKVNTEFRKGIMFIRFNGSLNKDNIDSISFNDFKYVVLNFDNLLSIDSYAIDYVINYSKEIEKSCGKLIICDVYKNKLKEVFLGKLPVIDNELMAFNLI